MTAVRRGGACRIPAMLRLCLGLTFAVLLAGAYRRCVPSGIRRLPRAISTPASRRGSTGRPRSRPTGFLRVVPHRDDVSPRPAGAAPRAGRVRADAVRGRIPEPAEDEDGQARRRRARQRRSGDERDVLQPRRCPRGHELPYASGVDRLWDLQERDGAAKGAWQWKYEAKLDPWENSESLITARPSWRSPSARRPTPIRRTWRCARTAALTTYLITQPAPPAARPSCHVVGLVHDAGALAGRGATCAPCRGVRAAAGRRGLDAGGALGRGWRTTIRRRLRAATPTRRRSRRSCCSAPVFRRRTPC